MDNPCMKPVAIIINERNDNGSGRSRLAQRQETCTIDETFNGWLTQERRHQPVALHHHRHDNDIHRGDARSDRHPDRVP